MPILSANANAGAGTAGAGGAVSLGQMMELIAKAFARQQSAGGGMTAPNTAGSMGSAGQAYDRSRNSNTAFLQQLQSALQSGGQTLASLPPGQAPKTSSSSLAPSVEGAPQVENPAVDTTQASQDTVPMGNLLSPAAVQRKARANTQPPPYQGAMISPRGVRNRWSPFGANGPQVFGMTAK